MEPITAKLYFDTAIKILYSLRYGLNYKKSISELVLLIITNIVFLIHISNGDEFEAAFKVAIKVTHPSYAISSIILLEVALDATSNFLLNWKNVKTIDEFIKCLMRLSGKDEEEAIEEDEEEED